MISGKNVGRKEHASPGGILEGLILPFSIIALWFFVSHAQLVSRSIFPYPEDVVFAFRQEAVSGVFWENLTISIGRVLKGFAIGASTGFVIGTLLGMSKIMDRLFTPVFNAVRQVPLPAWAPLLVLISIGETSRVLFIAIGACYPVVLNTCEGIRSVRTEYYEVGRVFRFNRFQRFFKIVLPSSFPSVLTGLRLSLSISWMAVVAAEIFMTSNGGIGDMMWSSRDTSRMDLVILCVITIAVVGFVMNRTMKKLELVFSFWRITLKQSRKAEA
ncbi:MAG: ABC transporter permease [Chlorobiaceae bacterium]|nr:ABC transporter permease [Chlorobiaceae bacterium]